MVPLFQILGPSLVPLLSKTGPLFGPSEGLFEGGTRLVITADPPPPLTLLMEAPPIRICLSYFPSLVFLAFLHEVKVYGVKKVTTPGSRKEKGGDPNLGKKGQKWALNGIC